MGGSSPSIELKFKGELFQCMAKHMGGDPRHSDLFEAVSGTSILMPFL